MTYTDPSKRYDFVMVFDVANGNPNGDPDADNLPRFDAETLHGLVSDVALKRKVRNYVAMYKDVPIFIQSQVALNTLISNAFQEGGVQAPQIAIQDEGLIEWFEQSAPELFSIENGTLTYGGEAATPREITGELTAALDESEENNDLRKKLQDVAARLSRAAKNRRIEPTEREDARQRMCRTYYDIRMFGAVLSTGLNAGQVRGPVQFAFARSADPIYTQNFLITRSARTTTARMQTGPTEFGRKTNVLYGLYRGHGFFNPKLAEQTGISSGDLEMFWEALQNMFEIDRSAARAEMAMQGLYVFTHDASPLGNAPAHRLFERIVIKRNDGNGQPRAFSDYIVTVNGEEMPVGGTVHFDEGVTLTRLC